MASESGSLQLMSGTRAFDPGLESVSATYGVRKLCLHSRKLLASVEPLTCVEPACLRIKWYYIANKMGPTFVAMYGASGYVGLTMTLDDPTKGVIEVVVSRVALLAGEPLWRCTDEVLDCEYSVLSTTGWKSCRYRGE